MCKTSDGGARGLLLPAVCLAAWLAGVFSSVPVAAEPFKVLAVMSYEEDYPWVRAIRKGILDACADACEVRFLYLDTKKDLAGGPRRAGEAYDVYRRWRPDGVIAADDNAQSMFVVPYLRDAVETPVMFCGVNADPAVYGYPCANVSGIVERLHLVETVAFVRLITPVDSVCFMMKDSPVAALVRRQVERDKENFGVPLRGVYLPATFREAVATASRLGDTCGMLLLESLEGVPGPDGAPMRSADVIPAVVRAFDGPTAGTDVHSVRYGALCSVVKSGEEQGGRAARMLLAAMRGTPVADLPVEHNFRGRRLLNVTTLKALGLRVRPMVLRGVQLVRTGE